VVPVVIVAENCCECVDNVTLGCSVTSLCSAGNYYILRHCLHNNLIRIKL